MYFDSSKKLLKAVSFLFVCSSFDLIAANKEPSLQQSTTDGLLYAGPNLNEDAYQLSIGADYVFWEVVQEGLETAGSYYGDTLYPTNQGAVYFPKFGMRSGFKVNAQKILEERDNIDLFIEYTWLQTSTFSNSGDLYPLSYYYPLYAEYEASSYYARYQINYNVLDFEIGRLSKLTKKYLDVRPFFGLRGVFNSSTWDAGANFADSPTTDTNYSSYQSTSGAGIRAGLDLEMFVFSEQNFLENLKIISCMAFSGVYGKTAVTTQVNGNYDLNLYTSFQNSKSTLNRIIPIVDLSIGLGYEKKFGGDQKDRYNFNLHALWETQTWINYGKSQLDGGWNTIGMIRPQTLSVQGLTIGGSIAF